MSEEVNVPEQQELPFKQQISNSFAGDPEPVGELAGEVNPAEQADTSEEPAEEPVAGEAEKAETPEEPAAPKAVPTEHVPYARFKEVNDKLRALEQQLAGQPSAQPKDVKPEPKADEFQELNEDQLKYLKEKAPEMHDAYMEQKREHDALKKLEARLEAKQQQQIREQQVKSYTDFHRAQITTEFPEIANTESQQYKDLAPSVEKLAKEIPAIYTDPGALRLALKYAALEKAQEALKEKVRAELKAEADSARSAKKGAALAGQVRSMGSSAEPKSIKDLFGGVPEFEKQK